ncbi:MAG: flippase-like domain-containing protein [Proteobacteria bacterium]|nr:flippase-like domain-containing protein [Pseudomonadota bacterium]
MTETGNREPSYSKVDPSFRTFFKGRGFHIAASAVFTIGIAALVWHNLSWGTLKEVFGRLDFEIALLSFAAYLMVTAMRALRFVIAGARLSFGSIFYITAVYAALLRVMPLKSGELAYGILLKKHGGGNFTEGLAAVLMLRILDLATILPFGAAIVITWLSGSNTGWRAFVVIAAGLMLGVLFFNLGPISRLAAAKITPLPERGLLRVVGRIVHTLAEAYSLPLSKRFALLGMTVIIWASVLVWFHLTLLAIGVVTTLDQGFVVGILGVAGSILPVSLIGSFGPMEGGFAIGLAAIGQNHSAVAAGSIVASTLTFITNWLVAIPVWILLMKSPTKPPNTYLNHESEGSKETRRKKSFRDI